MCSQVTRIVIYAGFDDLRWVRICFSLHARKLVKSRVFSNHGIEPSSQKLGTVQYLNYSLKNLKVPWCKVTILTSPVLGSRVRSSLRVTGNSSIFTNMLCLKKQVSLCHYDDELTISVEYFPYVFST